MLEYWLKISKNNFPDYVFSIIEITEKESPNGDVKSYLARQLLNSYRNLDFLKFRYAEEAKEKLIDYIYNNVLPSDKNRITKNVRQGDFGEILAELIVSYFLRLTVPLKKLRWKFNKDRSMFCTDMIAHNSGGIITDIYYYEIKTRLAIKKEDGNYVTINAHNSLLKDENFPNEAIADFLSKYYFEQNDLEMSKKYGDIVNNSRNYNRNFELFFIIEKSKYVKDILDDLNNLPPSLEPLTVTVVLVNGLGRLILDIQQKAIDGAIKYVYGE